MNLLQNADRLQNINPSQIIFYRAVVENNNDGGSGKVQVRIIGIHSANKEKIPTENLPWAEVMGVTSQHGGMSGIGISSVPLQGTWVWVFLDGGDWNSPVIVGLIIGTSSEVADTSEGFSDPNGEYPKEDRVGFGDVAKLATGTTTGTAIADIKNANRDTGIPTGNPATWEEPEEQSSKAKYPNNVVTETVSGNIIEMDETNGGRMHWFHNSGTYWEVVSGGDYTLKVVGDYYHIVDGNTFKYNKGNETYTVQGASINKIDGDRKTVIGSNDEEIILGRLDQKVSGSANQTFSSGLSISGGPIIDISATLIKLN